MKTRFKVILILIVLAVVTSVFSILEIISNPESNITLEEFEEKFGDEDIVKHFKEKYQAAAGWGKSPGMIMPEWGYISVNESKISELRLESNFGKYEFTYTCSDFSDKLFFKIKNPSIKDIDEIFCWDT